MWSSKSHVLLQTLLQFPYLQIRTVLVLIVLSLKMYFLSYLYPFSLSISSRGVCFIFIFCCKYSWLRFLCVCEEVLGEEQSDLFSSNFLYHC
ncbi:unnamed protein product [Moneuplotes crassus]|uniref:Uncharacterized protein n=1 Tax=Euplotes crassus TaxID=5936 RepID=A0AAD1Y2G8_EUPCR|nr:unnamed protein product [Moneuplotes crassus]